MIYIRHYYNIIRNCNSRDVIEITTNGLSFLLFIAVAKECTCTISYADESISNARQVKKIDKRIHASSVDIDSFRIYVSIALKVLISINDR